MQFKKLKLGALVAILVVTGGSAGANFDANERRKNDYVHGMITQPRTAAELLEMQERLSKADERDIEEALSKSLKLQAMERYAKSVAMRAGIQARVNEIREEIQRNARLLDGIYDFNVLMIEGRVVPPVISEAGRLYNQNSPNQINIAQKRYAIEKQARFSSVAPNWREYLQFPAEANAYSKYGYVMGEFAPKTAEEKTVWEQATVEGWALGVAQANILLEQAFERLNRDYIGMVRFNKFVMEGKITMPVIASYELHDTNNGTSMVIDETMLRIVVLPSFKDKNEIQAVQSNADPMYATVAQEYGEPADKLVENTDYEVEPVTEKPQPIIIDEQAQLMADNRIMPQHRLQDGEQITIDDKAIIQTPKEIGVETIAEDNGVAVDSVQFTINDQQDVKFGYEDRATDNIGIYGSQNPDDKLLIKVERQIK